MEFLRTLSESKLFPSQRSLDSKTKSQIADLTYRYLLILRILLLEEETHKFAMKYLRKTVEWGTFSKWHSNSNDLYVLLHGIEEIDHPTKGKGHFALNLDTLRRLLVQMSNDRDYEQNLRRQFLRLDTDLKIHNQSLSAKRRIVLDWEDQTTREKADTTEKLYKALRHDAPRSELLPELKKVMNEYLDERDDEISESLNPLLEGKSFRIPIREILMSKNSLVWSFKDLKAGRFSQSGDKPVIVMTTEIPEAIALSDGYHRVIEAILRRETHVQAVFNPKVSRLNAPPSPNDSWSYQPEKPFGGLIELGISESDLESVGKAIVLNARKGQA